MVRFPATGPGWIVHIVANWDLNPQVLYKFVSEKGECQYFSDLVVSMMETKIKYKIDAIK